MLRYKRLISFVLLGARLIVMSPPAFAAAGDVYPFTDTNFCQSLQKSLDKTPMTRWGDDWPSLFSSAGINFLEWKDVDSDQAIVLIKENFFESQLQDAKDVGLPYNKSSVANAWNQNVEPFYDKAIRIGAFKAQLAKVEGLKFQDKPIEVIRYGIDVRQYNEFYDLRGLAYQYSGPRYYWDYMIQEEVNPQSYRIYMMHPIPGRLSGEMAIKESYLILLSVPNKAKVALSVIFLPVSGMDGRPSVAGVCGLND
jgi:hypothetical protein